VSRTFVAFLSLYETVPLFPLFKTCVFVHNDSQRICVCFEFFVFEFLLFVMNFTLYLSAIGAQKPNNSNTRAA